jgi:hypothetical protein
LSVAAGPNGASGRRSIAGDIRDQVGHGSRRVP